MIRNTIDSWGLPARTLHWVVALAVLGLFAQGLWMDDLTGDARLYQIWLHAAVGITLLAVAGAGFAWWLISVVPAPPPGTPAWQRSSAQIAHWALYALILGAILTGWLLAGTLRAPIDVELFGLFPVPRLLEAGGPYHGALEEAHEIFSYLLVALAGAHAAAALYHHFVLRDPVLMRMIANKPKP